MAENSNKSDSDAASLSDAHMIHRMFTFFELTDWTMTCNDMLTKVFSVFNQSIDRGYFEDALRGFVLCLADNGLKKFRRISKDISYLDFQMIIAGLITRFANLRSVRDVMDNKWTSTPSNCTAMNIDMDFNNKAINMSGEYSHADVNLVTTGKLTVIDPKQAALLVFLFHTYYSSKSKIVNQMVCNFMEILERIDEELYGLVEVDSGDVDSDSDSAEPTVKDELIQRYGGNDLVLVKYILGQYDQIMMMLNCCMLQYDFLNTAPNHRNKKLVEHYVAAIMSLPSRPDEVQIWSLFVNDTGIVIPYENLSIDGAMTKERLAFIFLTSLMLKDPQSKEDNRPYIVQYFEELEKVNQLMSSKQYANYDPYNPEVTRDPTTLSINSRKLDKMKEMIDLVNGV